MENTRVYIYNVAICSTAIGFFLFCSGVFCPNWWILKDRDERAVDIFDLFGNVLCYNEYCLASYLTKNPEATQKGWLVAVRFLSILSLLLLFAALIIQITHTQYQRVQLLRASLALLSVTGVLIIITSGIVISRVLVLTTSHHHPHQAVTLRMQTLPLILIIMSIPCCIISLFTVSYAVCTIKRQSYPTVI